MGEKIDEGKPLVIIDPSMPPGRFQAVDAKGV